LIDLLIIIFLVGDPALVQGDALHAKGFYDEAITEYQRYIFFNPDGARTSDVYYHIGLVCRDQQKWEQSIDAFRMAMHTALSDSLRYRAELALATAYIASGNYSAGEIVLLKLEMSMPPAYIKVRAVFLRALATLYAKKWDQAEKAFKTYFLSNPDPDMQAQVDSLIRETKDFYYLSPETARQLSTLIPGLGQIYAGDWGHGLNSLVLNGSMIAWMGYKIYNRYFNDAWTIYYFLFRRYYAGGRYNAERIAQEYNDTFDKTQAQKIIDLFLEE